MLKILKFVNTPSNPAEILTKIYPELYDTVYNIYTHTQYEGVYIICSPKFIPSFGLQIKVFNY